MSAVSDSANDMPTPITDKLIDEMRCGYGIPKCAEWDRLEEHAREMERQVATYRAVAVAIMKDEGERHG